MISSATELSGGERPTARFSAFCASFSASAIPEPVRRQAKLILLDTFGAMLSASRPSFQGTRLLSEFVQREQADGPCSVVGTELRTSATNAALMNGYLGYALDIESHHGPAIAHAAAAVLPAVLATAQEQRSSGSELLAALTLGIDVTCRVNLAIGPNDLYERGFHPSSVGGTFGAAAAAGHLLHLTAKQFENAMGLSATETGGLLAWASDDTEESRPFNPGLAARNGVTAARLAALGFGAPQGIFDIGAKYNAFRAWSLDGQGKPDLLVEALGDSFAINELTIKRYACCAFLHPGLDGLLSILSEEGVYADQIMSITMYYPRSGAPIIDNNELRSHRAQYILPVASLRDEVLFEDVIEDRSAEPGIQRLAAVTTVVHDDDLDRTYPERYATIVKVVTSDGRTLSRRVDYALGGPENPMSENDIVAKFHRLAGQRGHWERIERIEGLVMSIDGPESIDDLIEALTVV